MSLEKRIMSDSGQVTKIQCWLQKEKNKCSEDSMMGGIKYKKAKNRKNKQKNKN